MRCAASSPLLPPLQITAAEKEWTVQIALLANNGLEMPPRNIGDFSSVINLESKFTSAQKSCQEKKTKNIILQQNPRGLHRELAFPTRPSYIPCCRKKSIR